MVQVTVLDGQFFDILLLFDDGSLTPEVGVGFCDIADGFAAAAVIVVIDEGADLVF